jgi:hypothetical protein
LAKLNEQRGQSISSMTGRDFSPKSKAMKSLAKTERRISTLRKAEDFYDQNPKAGSRRTRRR